MISVGILNDIGQRYKLRV